MHWHLQATSLLARAWPDEMGVDGQDCFDRGEPYAAIATVQLLGAGRANIIGHLRSGDPIGQREYRKLLLKLRAEYGVQTVTWVHDGEDGSHDTAPAPLL